MHESTGFADRSATPAAGTTSSGSFGSSGAPSSGSGPVAAARRRVPAALPAWGFTWFLVGYPLVWALGASAFAVPVAGAVAGLLLVLRGHARLPRLWLPWTAFLVWSLASGAMVDTGGRMLGFVLRWTSAAGASLLALYAYNARERLTRTRVLRAFTWMFAWVVAGGYLGMARPWWRLATPLLRMAPANLASNTYVLELLSPRAAEVQDPWGASRPFVRPAAPFPYTNGWGFAYVMLLPLVAALFLVAGRRLRVVLVLLAAASVPPALATLNRGMFLGLGVVAAGLVWRHRRRIRLGHVLRALAVLVVAGGLLLSSGVLDRIGERTSASSTTQDRLAVYVEAFTRTLQSPLLGWGAPRPSATLQVSVGTQGHVWAVMFCHGFVGLAFFLATVWGLVVVTRRVADLQSLLVHLVLAASAVLVVFYGLDGLHLVVLLSCGALLLRSELLPGTRLEARA